MKTPSFRFKIFTWFFIHFKVPMIGYTRPKIIELNDERLVAKIPLNRRTKNHLHSMYFGTLAVGADLAGGLHGFYHADKSNEKVSLAFKSFQAQFLKRPESDVYFVSGEGQAVADMIKQSKTEQTRINRPISIEAFTHYETTPELVATFTLELSIKVIS